MDCIFFLKAVHNKSEKNPKLLPYDPQDFHIWQTKEKIEGV